MFKRFKNRAGEELFASLFCTCKNRLFGYVFAISHSRYAAEEITQEIFLKLWLCRNELHLIGNPELYLFAIAKNKTLNYLRKAQYDEKFIREIKNRMNPLSNDVEEQVSISENNRLLQEAITMLSPQRQLVYRLSRYEGLDHKQIAEEMQLSRNTVKNHMVQALRFIRTYLNNKGILIFILSFLFA